MDIQPIEILKWIGLVLAAGFIGYIGRYLSMLIIDKLHKRKSTISSTSEEIRNTSTKVDSADRDNQKLEKKRLKQQSKIAKKQKKGLG